MTHNPKKTQCHWIHKPNRREDNVYKSAEYCGAPVRYHILKDDDNNPYRQYDNFCPEHTKMAAAMFDPEEVP